MSLHKYALIRYRIIDGMIRNPHKPYPNIEDLREKCEYSLFGSEDGRHISISTIEKDLRAMRDDMELAYHAPIKYSRSHRGYYYEDPEYSIQSIPLNDDDVDAIKLAANTLFNFRESPLFSQFRFAIDKIFDRLNISDSVQDESIDQLVQFDNYPDYPGNEYLNEIYSGISTQHEIEIRYLKFGDSEVSKQVFHPYLLKEYKYRWYVIGFSPKREKIITFALDRIKGVSVLEGVFLHQEGFNAESFFRHSFGITEGKEAPVKITLSLTSDQKGYLETMPLHNSQVMTTNEEGIIIELFLVPSYEFYEKLLSFGPKLRVIKPLSIQKKLKKLLTQALENYK